MSPFLLLATLQALGAPAQAGVLVAGGVHPEAPARPAAPVARVPLGGQVLRAEAASLEDAGSLTDAAPERRRARGPLRAARFAVARPAGVAAAAQVPPTDAWLGTDKARHFFLSFAATALAHGVLRTAGLDGGAALGGAAGVAVAAGSWKELRDRRIPGETASVRDLVWDLLGVAAGVALLSGI